MTEFHGMRVQYKFWEAPGLAVDTNDEDTLLFYPEDDPQKEIRVYIGDVTLDNSGETRFYIQEADADAGHDFPFGPETMGIVDSEEGGIIAWTHSDHSATLLIALRVASRRA